MVEVCGDVEVASLFSSQSVHSSVSSVVVVSGLHLNLAVLGALDGDGKVVAAKGLGLLSLVPRLHSEREDAEARVVNVGTLLALDLPGGVLDGVSLEVNRDIVGSGLSGVEGHTVGAIAVVVNVRLDGAAGTVDGYVKVIASISARLASGIHCMNGENAGLVIDETVESGTFGPKICWHQEKA